MTLSFLERILRRFNQRDGAAQMRERLESFRALLEANNRVLELIADAGEKLGGEYLFDIQYLRTLAADLEEAMHEVVYNLQAVTGGRYQQLVDTVWEIAAEVRAIVESRLVVPKGDLVLPLDFDLEHADVVGGKMARLGEVKQHLGLRVPDGFAVSAYACRLFLEGAGIDPTSVQASVALPNELGRRVLEAPLPQELRRAILAAIKRLGRGVETALFAVRSSALGEDGQASFAGLYETVLGVSADRIFDAYRKVVASLYSDNVMNYRQRSGLPRTQGLMPVGVLRMVPARAAGVVYTLNPAQPDKDVLVVSATLGLGKTVVDGSAQVDRFEVSRVSPHSVISRDIAVKERMYVVEPDRGLQWVSVPASDQRLPAISDAELQELAATALTIERYMKRAQDIEWALDHEGRLYILQLRPLVIAAGESPVKHDLQEAVAHHPVLLEGRGAVACRGIGCGCVYIVGQDCAVEPPPEAVLVARTSSPRLAASVATATAVITDVGSTTGHLAAIAREFRVPTIVDTGNATEVLQNGWEVTVDAEENIVYGGVVEELVRHQLMRQSSFEEKLEFRLLRRILKKTAPLNLVDPESPEFSPANCVTYHDVIRFAHEVAVRELIHGHWVRAPHAGRTVHRLRLAVPLDLVVVDLGDGLSGGVGPGEVDLEDVRSAPLRALLEGLLAEGAWPTEPAEMDLGGFMSSATRGGTLTGPLMSKPEQNLAIVSAGYLHLSLKLGYHFNVVDCYLADQLNHNYIYFRFAGGVTELTRRARRAEVLKRILETYDFVTEGTGDLVIGRIKKVGRDEMESRLRMIGRLVGFTRQLDILLRDDAAVDEWVNRFVNPESTGVR